MLLWTAEGHFETFPLPILQIVFQVLNIWQTKVSEGMHMLHRSLLLTSHQLLSKVAVVAQYLMALENLVWMAWDAKLGWNVLTHNNGSCFAVFKNWQEPASV